MPALVKPQAERGMILKDVPVPEIGKNDVLIRVLKTGICGTDVHIYQWDEWAQRRIHPPLVVGHEFMGMVERVGEAVDEFKPGDLVSGEGHIGCGHCFFCRTGLGHICRTMKIIGVDRDGCFARFISMPQSNVWRLKPGTYALWGWQYVRWWTMRAVYGQVRYESCLGLQMVLPA